jgi:hypothetical protein
VAFRAAICSRALGRLWVPPAGHYDPAARSIAVRPPGDNPGDGSAAHGRKSPRVERREARRPDRKGCRALREECPGVPITCTPTGASRQRVHARLDALCTGRRLGAPLPVMRGKETERTRRPRASFGGQRKRCCVRTTGKEDDRENELKPFVAVQRVRLPRGKGQPASRKQALHVCGNVTREAYGSRCRSCVLAPKSAIAEAFAVNAAGAAST